MPGECLEVRSTARRQLEAFGKLSPRGQDSLTMNGICLVRSKPRVSSGQWVLTLTQCCKLASGSPQTPTKPSLLVFLPSPSFLFPFPPLFLSSSSLLLSFLSFFFWPQGYQVFMSAKQELHPGVTRPVSLVPSLNCRPPFPGEHHRGLPTATLFEPDHHLCFGAS